MMKEKIGVLIADDDVEFGNELSVSLSKHEDIHVFGVAEDGQETVEMIKILAPDVVVLDIIMPYLDGIGVLERFCSPGIKQKPIFIALSGVAGDRIIEKMFLLGAEWYMLKPVEVSMLAERIRQAYREKCLSLRHSLERKVTELMHKEGIPPHLIGYRYIREAIIHAVLTNSNISTNSNVLIQDKKMLYSSVAKKFNTTSEKIARGIRNALQYTARRISYLSGTSTSNIILNTVKHRTSNLEFITRLAEKVQSYIYNEPFT